MREVQEMLVLLLDDEQSVAESGTELVDVFVVHAMAADGKCQLLFYIVMLHDGHPLENVESCGVGGYGGGEEVVHGSSFR